MVVHLDKETKNQIMGEVKQEFLRHNPKFTGIRMSYNFLIKKMINYYLGRP